MTKILGADMLPLIRQKLPTKVSQLTNDSQFVTDSTLNSTVQTLQTAIEGKQDTLESGKNIKTINNIPILGAGNIHTMRYDGFLGGQKSIAPLTETVIGGYTKVFAVPLSRLMLLSWTTAERISSPAELIIYLRAQNEDGSFGEAVKSWSIQVPAYEGPVQVTSARGGGDFWVASPKADTTYILTAKCSQQITLTVFLMFFFSA